jgi:hypothetical protein
MSCEIDWRSAKEARDAYNGLAYVRYHPILKSYGTIDLQPFFLMS